MSNISKDSAEKFDLPDKLKRDSPDEKLPAPKDLDRAIMALLYHEPFYGHVVQKMRRVVTDDLPTLAVGIKDSSVVFAVNPYFWNHYDGRLLEQVSLLKHEVWHLINEHPFRIKNRTPDIWNAAADLAINCKIQNLPPGGLYPKDFDLPNGQIAEWYYDELLKHMQDCGGNSSGKGCGNAVCQQRGGSGEGDDDDQGDGDGEGEGDDDGDGGSNGQSGKGKHPHIGPVSLCDHSLWGNEELADSDEEYMRQQVRQIINDAIKEAKKQRGKFPADLEQLIQKAMHKPQRWKKKLRMFAHFATLYERIPSRRRPNRRTGFINPGKGLDVRLRLALAVDTSGSVTQRQLDQFAAEIDKIAESADVVVIECDARVHRVFEYKPGCLKKFHGRGGTDFRPAFKVADEEVKPDGLIFLTDGYGPAPDKRPRYPVMWAFTKDHNPPVQWGKRLVLEV